MITDESVRDEALAFVQDMLREAYDSRREQLRDITGLAASGIHTLAREMHYLKIVHEMLADRPAKEPETNTWFIRSSTDPNKAYLVQQAGDDWSCACPDYVHRRHACKHIKLVQSELSGVSSGY